MEHIPGIQNSWTQGTALASVDGCLTGSLDMVQRHRLNPLNNLSCRSILGDQRYTGYNYNRCWHWKNQVCACTTWVRLHQWPEPTETLLPLATTLWGEIPFVWKVCNHRLCSWIACIYCILNSIKSKPIWQTIGQTRSIRIRKMLDRWCALQGLQMLPQCGVNIADQISHQ